jgi:hypothetical protein
MSPRALPPDRLRRPLQALRSAGAPDVLLVSIVACVLGALAGLILFVPLLAGAWVLNAFALVGYEEKARPGWIERLHASTGQPWTGADVVPIPVAAGAVSPVEMRDGRAA